MITLPAGRRLLTLLLAGALAVAPLTAAPSLAQDAAHTVTLGALQISGAFTRATPPNAPVGGGYLTILNTGADDDRLVSVATPVAKTAQIHEMKMEGDVMKMGQLKDGLLIPAGSTITLEPGRLHLMFTGLSQRFVEGESVPVTLTFEKAGSVDITLLVGALNADEMPKGEQ